MSTRAAQASLIEHYHLLSYDVLDSTNEEARRLAEGGGAHGAVIWAKRQTAGRGRMGREWVSPEGNLYVSLLLQPSPPMETWAQLSFVASLAMAETLDAIVANPKDVACKWPNDLLLRGRKLGGILLESFSCGPSCWLSVGVGLNIDSYPEHVMFPATCLRDAGVELVSAKIVLSRFVHHFIEGYDDWCANGFSATRKAWLKRACRKGEMLEVRVGDEVLAGVFTGMDEAGRLLLKDDFGAEIAVHAGDVFFGTCDAARG